MQQAPPQQRTTDSEPLSRQVGEAPLTEQAGAFAATLADSPQVQRQRNLAARMQASPVLAAQHRLRDTMVNGTLQAVKRQAGDSAAAQAVPAQRSAALREGTRTSAAAAPIQMIGAAELTRGALLSLGMLAGLGTPAVYLLLKHGAVYTRLTLLQYIKQRNLQRSIQDLVQIAARFPALSADEILQIGEVPVANDLANTIINTLNAVNDVAIHNVAPDERRAVLANAGLRAAVRTQADAPILMSALMEGSQHWENPPKSDFYRYFVTYRGNGVLPDTSSMNCWESILYAFYLAGQKTADDIRQLYQSAAETGGKGEQFWPLLGFHSGLAIYEEGRNVPAAGQVLFYVRERSSHPSHVALSLGGDDAQSLWEAPRRIKSVQRIRVNDLQESRGTVYFGNLS